MAGPRPTARPVERRTGWVKTHDLDKAVIRVDTSRHRRAEAARFNFSWDRAQANPFGRPLCGRSWFFHARRIQARGKGTSGLPLVSVLQPRHIVTVAAPQRCGLSPELTVVNKAVLVWVFQGTYHLLL